MTIRLLRHPAALCAADLWLFEWHPGEGMEPKHAYIFSELEAVVDWLISEKARDIPAWASF